MSEIYTKHHEKSRKYKKMAIEKRSKRMSKATRNRRLKLILNNIKTCENTR